MDLYLISAINRLFSRKIAKIPSVAFLNFLLSTTVHSYKVLKNVATFSRETIVGLKDRRFEMDMVDDGGRNDVDLPTK